MKVNKRKLAEDYFEVAAKLAVIIGQVDEIKTTCGYLRGRANDNGDPYFDLQPALEHLGVALAAAVVYADEYKEEAGKEDGKTE